jgi:hypothetical protein
MDLGIEPVSYRAHFSKLTSITLLGTVVLYSSSLLWQPVLILLAFFLLIRTLLLHSDQAFLTEYHLTHGALDWVSWYSLASKTNNLSDDVYLLQMVLNSLNFN